MTTTAARDFRLTYLFISHDLSVVEYLSDRVGVMRGTACASMTVTG